MRVANEASAAKEAGENKKSKTKEGRWSDYRHTQRARTLARCVSLDSVRNWCTERQRVDIATGCLGSDRTDARRKIAGGRAQFQHQAGGRLAPLGTLGRQFGATLSETATKTGSEDED